ncbi:MAG: outer membrane lipoprotein-sorting protein [Mariprofundaceae bacterium]|nr:outer membrane lipoprotein-sorting protein [Mariprofundaceae bacterium]
MGSDFSNDDLVKSSDVVEDYTHRLLSHEKGVYRVESIPKETAAVVWSKLIHDLNEDGMPLSEEFYDEHGKLIRTITYDHIQSFDCRKIPSRWIVHPHNKPKQSTIMEIKAIVFDVEITDSIFKRSHMRRQQR